MPNLTFDSLEVIPEGLKEHAKANDAGKFVVDVVPGVKLNEFRDRNIAVSQQLEVATGVLSKLKPVVGDDIDVFLATFGEMSKTAQQVKDGKLKATDAIETEVLNRVGVMKTGFETRLQELTTEAATSRTEAKAAKLALDNSVVERAVTDAVVNERSGANPGALSDILERAYKVFKIVDGKMIAKEGEFTVMGADGATPMTPMEWMVKLREQAPYLFKNSNGGGATGNTGSGTGFRGTGLTQEAYWALSPMAKAELSEKMKSRK